MVTPTADLGRLVTELNKVQIGGAADLLRAIQTAQLALKHRQNKKQKQRIIAFVGSPVTATDKELEALGKNLKKNSVALDLVSFGEVEENAPKLEKLMNALNSNDTSHLLEAPVGPKLLSDILLSSSIINPDGEAGGGGEGAGFEFGINPNEDPELALALRISMEEERARQEAASGGDGAAAAPAEAAATPAPAAAAAPADPAPAASLPVAPDAAVMEAMGMEDMDEELRQALLLSMQEMEPAAETAAPKRKADEMEATALGLPRPLCTACHAGFVGCGAAMQSVAAVLHLPPRNVREWVFAGFRRGFAGLLRLKTLGKSATVAGLHVHVSDIFLRLAAQILAHEVSLGPNQIADRLNAVASVGLQRHVRSCARMAASDDHVMSLQEQEPSDFSFSVLEGAEVRIAITSLGNETLRVMQASNLQQRNTVYEDAASFWLQAVRLLQTLNANEDASSLLDEKERPDTIKAIASLARKFHAQLLNRPQPTGKASSSDALQQQTSREVQIYRLIDFAMPPSVDDWFCIFETRLDAVYGDGLAGGRQVYLLSVQGALETLQKYYGTVVSNRCFACWNFAAAFYQAVEHGQVRSITEEELEWVVAKPADFQLPQQHQVQAAMRMQHFTRREGARSTHSM
ncbi:unnamed protein product [Effrenium voratum]|uniref:VWFA domain-containing protein n=1 Tax=Effrenium voratum TaxID=2562239 RepID=A0AA36I3Y7_9DINO|nr:unnamed protein product [Effrenium voratum]